MILLYLGKRIRWKKNMYSTAQHNGRVYDFARKNTNEFCVVLESVPYHPISSDHTGGGDLEHKSHVAVILGGGVGVSHLRW